MEMEQKRMRLGELLVKNRLLSKEQLEYALKYHSTSRQMLGVVLNELNMINEEQLIDVLIQSLPPEKIQQLAESESKAFTELEAQVDTELLKDMNTAFCRSKKVMPIRLDEDGRTLTVAMADVNDLGTAQELHFITNYQIKPVKAHLRDLEKLFAIFCPETISEEERGNQRLVGQIGLQSLVSRISESNVPQFTDAVFQQAVAYRSTDIHIDPFQDMVMIRYRIDGILHPVCEMTHKVYTQVCSRIKVQANLDISEKRHAQEGRISVQLSRKAGTKVDLRVSVVPTFFGERIAIRVLDPESSNLKLDRIGLSPENREVFTKNLGQRQGLILITGPTGSGKTTTIYSMLDHINDLSRNIMTIEDPVEYLVKGMAQVQADERHDITYSSVLKIFLRQNPDVVFVGEIRDSDTAEMAARAALTGHLVISTLHTNDTSTAVTRMADLGVAPYILGPALSLVVAQRLVRRICPKCRRPSDISTRDLLRAGLKPNDIGNFQFHEGEGCAHCAYTGMRGVTAVHEVMSINKGIREKIMHGANAITLRSLAMRGGMHSLKTAALEKAKHGEISIYETNRVAYNIT